MPQNFATIIKSEDVENISTDLLEFGIDQIMDDEILKDFPFIGFIYKVFKTGKNIQNAIFLKKILHFLFNLKDIPHDKRIKMLNKIDSDKKTRTKSGEAILMILDKAYEYEICQIIGFLFQKFIEEKISYSDFLRASKAINQLYVYDLKWFLKWGWSTLESNQSTDALYYCGLLKLDTVEQTIDQRLLMKSELKVEYKKTRLGEEVYRLLRDSEFYPKDWDNFRTSS